MRIAQLPTPDPIRVPLAGPAIVNDPRVHEIGVHRTAGLEGRWLVATTAASELAR
jgi:hypothetical protein